MTGAFAVVCHCEPSEPHLSSPPLWRQLQAAAAVLGAVRAGESTTPVLARVDADVRPAAQALAFQALRQLGRADALRRQLARRAPPPEADALLCTALALCWREDEAPYTPITLVDQAVEAAERRAATAAPARLLKFGPHHVLRERDAPVTAPDQEPGVDRKH